MKYDVSILVPVYKVAKFIERSIHSLFNQSYDKIEFIFVDDCSPDNSIEILRTVMQQYPHRLEHINIITHERNRGLAAARNTAIANARGTFILQIDSDDFIESTMVSEMFELAIRENADIVMSDYYIQWATRKKYVTQTYTGDKGQFLQQLLSATAMPAVWNKMIRRELYLRNNIKASEGVNIGEDLAVMPKLVYNANKIVKINKAYVYYVQFNNHSYTKTFSVKSLKDISWVLNDLESYFNNTHLSEQAARSLTLARITKKIEWLKSANRDNLAVIISTFPMTITSGITHHLNVIDKLILHSSEWSRISCYVCIAFYRRLFTVLQFLKGR